MRVVDDSLLKYVFGLILLFCAGTAHGQLISDPTAISGLVVWTDANDVNGTGVQPANGALVTSWADKSGNGNHLTTTTTNAPSFETTGFDALYPGLRFAVGKRLAGPNPFGTTYHDEMTVFFINANVTLTNNFAVSLNGTNTGTSTTDGRFSFHTPWSNSTVYFDGGACCGATRLSGSFPNTTTETTLFMGLNDNPGSQQILRIDGQALASDSSGLNANVSRGTNLGSIPWASYDGRFGEFIVYDRALSTSEVDQVECYLLLKWKPGAASPPCSLPVLDASKTVAVFDPGGLGLYSIPGNDVIYTIELTHLSGSALDAGTMFLVDTLPNEVTFYNGDIDGAGPETDPLSFTETASGLSFNYATDAKYSNSATRPTSMADCTYTPVAGYDPAVQHICMNPSGSFTPGSPPPTAAISFRVRID